VPPTTASMMSHCESFSLNLLLLLSYDFILISFELVALT